jgi:hypothetical protein
VALGGRHASRSDVQRWACRGPTLEPAPPFVIPRVGQSGPQWGGSGPRCSAILPSGPLSPKRACPPAVIDAVFQVAVHFEGSVVLS